MELYLEAYTSGEGSDKETLIAWQTPDSKVHIMTVGTPDAAGWQYWERNSTGAPGTGVPIAALKQEASKDAKLLLSIDGLGPAPITANLLHVGDDHARKFYYAVDINNGQLGVPVIVLRAEGLEVTPFDVPKPGAPDIKPPVTLRFDVRRTHIDPRHQGASGAMTQFAGLPP